MLSLLYFSLCPQRQDYYFLVFAMTAQKDDKGKGEKRKPEGGGVGGAAAAAAAPAKRKKKSKKKNPKQGGGGSNRVLAAHDSQIEVNKANNTVMLWVPGPIFNAIEAKAANWKSKFTPGEGHPDKVTCVAVRCSELITQMQENHAGKTLVSLARPDHYNDLTKMVKVLAECPGDLITHIALRKSRDRAQHLSPFEVSIPSSLPDMQFRALLLGVSVLGDPNAAPRPWLCRPYAPRRRPGPLLKEAKEPKGNEAEMRDDAER